MSCSAFARRGYYGEGTYPISCPSGRVISGPPAGSYWRVSRSRFHEFDRDRRIWWGEEGNNVPAIKRFLSEVKEGRVPQTLWTHEEVGHTQEAKKELIAALEFPNSDTVFETPKPTRLIQRMLQLATRPDAADLVLDFFAGSGTTTCAVFQQNALDGGNRRCILVQLPEPLPPSESTSLRTISDVTKERLRRTGSKVREEWLAEAGKREEQGTQPGLLDPSAPPPVSREPVLPDLGFRVFKLASSNIRAWDPDRENLDQTLLNSVEHLKTDRTEADILYELLLKLGLDLCVPIEKRSIAGKDVHAVGGGVLLTCLATEVSTDEVEALAQGIVDWHRILAPAGGTWCVFRDSAFADDVAKTNLSAILQQHGLTPVRSL